MLYRMKEICNKEYQNFFSLKNVNGVAIGNKIINSYDTGILCLKIFVEKKEDISMLDKKDKIPKYYDSILTDVVEVGKIEALANTGKIRPAQGGYSIGVVGANKVGTFGCLVSKGAGSGLETYILSNNHVMALENTVQIGTGILQPGDGGVNPTDLVAHLSDYKPIDFSGASNSLDCAIAKVDDLSIVSKSIASIGNISGIASAVIGTAVQKNGRTTGYTTGTITGINATVNVNFGSQVVTFINQITTTVMSQAGDSGSIVLDSQNRVIGLLFAGSTSLTALNDIRTVLRYFKARLV